MTVMGQQARDIYKNQKGIRDQVAQAAGAAAPEGGGTGQGGAGGGSLLEMSVQREANTEGGNSCCS